MIGYIYVIKNDINDKLYVGQTINRLSRRFSIHCNPNNNSNGAITKAICKYGKRHCKILAVEIIEDDVRDNLLDKLNLLEKSYIQTFNSLAPNGYNLLVGGKNTSKPLWLKKKISQSLLGNPKLATWKGKKFSEEHKLRLAESNKMSKPVVCVETGQTFNSIAKAAKEFDIPRVSMSVALRTKGIYSGKVTIRYYLGD